MSPVPFHVAPGLSPTIIRQRFNRQKLQSEYVHPTLQGNLTILPLLAFPLNPFLQNSPCLIPSAGRGVRACGGQYQPIIAPLSVRIICTWELSLTQAYCHTISWPPNHLYGLVPSLFQFQVQCAHRHVRSKFSQLQTWYLRRVDVFKVGVTGYWWPVTRPRWRIAANIRKSFAVTNCELFMIRFSRVQLAGILWDPDVNG